MKRFSLYGVIGTSILAAILCGCLTTQQTSMSEIDQQVEELQKDGWSVLPGESSLRAQLDRSIKAEEEVDTQGFRKNYIGIGSTVGRTQQAALQAATELAWQNLVSTLGGTISRAVQTDLSNNQIDATTAASITKVMNAATTQAQRTVGPSRTLFRVKRTLPNGNVEVQMRIAYSVEDSKALMLQEAQTAMTKELARESKEFRQSVSDYLMGPFKQNPLDPKP